MLFVISEHFNHHSNIGLDIFTLLVDLLAGKFKSTNQR